MLPKVKKLKKNIYLDYAAATPLDAAVKKVMQPFLGEKFGNPSSLYKEGREAKDAIDQARHRIAGLIKARPNEVIFTAGGTESVNLAIFGVARSYSSSHHLITSAIEHDCVLNSFKALAGEGYKTSLVKVDAGGLISLNDIKKSIRPETILISVMYANNEIGTIQPIAEIGKWLKQLNAERLQKKLPKILFHTDACQAAGYLNLNVDTLGVDLMSVNGSKIYGPKQTGFLYARSGVSLKPLIYGGGQEKDLRSGTENVAGVVGLAKALELVTLRLRSGSTSGLQDYLITQAQSKINDVLLNGAYSKGIKVYNQNRGSVRNNETKLIRLPNNVNFFIKGVEGEALMLYLDSYGISCSTSSACSTQNNDPSHVLMAIGRSELQAKSSIRFTLGKFTTKKEIDYLIHVLPNIINALRRVK